MSIGEAIDYVLSEGEEPADTTAPAQKRSCRDEEIAPFVAQGLTNRQIATELSISEHTVASHVGRTMRKPGLSSRSQLAAWEAAQQGLPSLEQELSKMLLKYSILTMP